MDQRLQDFKEVNQVALQNTIKSAIFLLVLALLFAAYQLIQILVNTVLFSAMAGGGTIFIGFLSYIIKVILYSHFLGVVSDVVMYNRLSSLSLTSGFQRYIAPVSQVAFSLYLVEILLSRLGGGLGVEALVFIEALLYLYISPVPSMLYIDGASGYGALMESAEFWKENWHAWGPVAVLAIVLMSTVGRALSVVFLIGSIDIVLVSILRLFLSGLLVAIFMVYMGHLYRQLSGSSMRGRAFKRRARG